jgi:hypothetical protein
MLVDILLEDDVISLAKVVETLDKTLKVQYFVTTTKKYGDQRVYDYEDTVEEVEKECVNGYYDADEDESAAGFTYIENLGFIRSEDESDYDPESELESSDDESESELDEEELEL